MPSATACHAQRLMLRDILRSWGGKQSSLAHAIGACTGSVSRWLSGERDLTWETVHAAIAVTLATFPEAGADVARSLSLHVAGVVVEPVFVDDHRTLDASVEAARATHLHVAGASS